MALKEESFYGKIKKFIVAFYAVLFVIALAGLKIQTNRLEQTQQQLDNCRTELSRAANQQLLLAGTVDKCFTSARRTAEVLSESANSVKDLRRQLEEVRENYQNMEVQLLDCYDRMRNSSNTMEDK